MTRTVTGWRWALLGWVVLTGTLLQHTPGAGAVAQKTGAGLAITLRIEQLSDLEIPALAQLQSLGPVDGSARLSVAGETLRLDDIDARVQMPGAELRVTGTVTDAARGTGADLAFTVTAESAARLRGGVADPGDGPVTLRGRLLGGGEIVDFVDLVLTAPGSQVTGALNVATGGERPKITGTLDATTLDLSRALPDVVGPSQDDGRLFPDDALPLTPITAFDSQVTLKARSLTLRRFAATDATVSLTSSATDTSIRVNGRHGDGQFEGSARLLPAGTGTETQLVLSLKGITWEAITRDLGKQDYVDGGPTRADIDVRGRGRSVRALMATLNGRIRMHVGPGRIFNTVLDDAGLDLMDRMVDLVTPREDQSRFTDVECAAVELDIRDGIATARNGLVVITRKVTMVGTGRLDLRDETLSMLLDLKARKGFSFSPASLAGGASITGTLLAPVSGINTAGLGRSAITVAGAALTGGLSLLAQRALAASGKPSCESALAAPAPVTKKARDKTEVVEDAAGTDGERAGAVSRGLRELVDN